MTPRWKMNRFKQWLSDFLTPKAEVHYHPDGPKRHTGLGGLFSHAQDITLHNPTMTAVQGNQYMTYVQGDRNVVPQIMKLLSDHIILGAAHDDSARVPPPRCHPGTRISLIARITAWFNNDGPYELLLWITGPAGVGKSAIVQTFAEYLVEAKLLGASVFCSRPNKRNNPHRIFITIAYQLAIRIPAYREFVVERLSLDPQLLNRDIATQFKTFIIEPFVEKKIGAGGRRWGILLDGLDELEGEDVQCEIIQLISDFAHNHRDAPLIWIIASRPELNVSNMFEDDEVCCGCWKEYIPIDSIEACEDVERFLRSSFKATQKKFRHSTPRDWPSDTDFLKITAAASGLFVYAEVVMQFIRDPDHANPVSRLEVLLSVIDRSTAVQTKENPFVHLDALYHEILSSIPPTLWPSAKQLLAFTVHRETGSIGKLLSTFLGVSIIFNLNRHTAYACLTKCRSTINIPDWQTAHKTQLTLLHASFADYLNDPSRSRDFYVGNRDECTEGVRLKILEIWNKCSGDNTSTASIKSAWQQYCSELNGGNPSKAIAKFHEKLFHDLVLSLRRLVGDVVRGTAASPTCGQLRKVHMINLCYYFTKMDMVNFAHLLTLRNFQPGFYDVGLCWATQLGDLQLGHLGWQNMSPVRLCFRQMRGLVRPVYWVLDRPRSSTELSTFVSELENLRERLPKLGVIIFGGVLEGRVAVFHRPAEKNLLEMYYVIPYPE